MSNNETPQFGDNEERAQIIEILSCAIGKYNDDNGLPAHVCVLSYGDGDGNIATIALKEEDVMKLMISFLGILSCSSHNELSKMSKDIIKKYGFDVKFSPTDATGKIQEEDKNGD